MEEKLLVIKPCPCCGSTAQIDNGRISELVTTLKCLNRKCGLMMIRSGTSRIEADEKAVNAWNRRAEA